MTKYMPKGWIVLEIKGEIKSEILAEGPEMPCRCFAEGTKKIKPTSTICVARMEEVRIE